MSETAPRRETPRFAVPVDPLTGEALSDAQLSRIDRIKTAHDALLDVLHEAEGTQSGSASFSTRRMAIAATQIEIGVLMAIRGALETR